MIPVPFVYNPSDDGTDENLLILLHGLGDTQVPFGKLGRQLHLPQTATLALRAPEQIPFLYEQAFQWYTSFDPLGELIDRPNPTPALDLMSKVVEHLTKDCRWPPHRIHLFGFAQGGSVAAEFALKYWRSELSLHQKSLPSFDANSGSDASEHAPRAFGSIVSVSGPLLSYPTLSRPCPTPFLILHRPPPAESALAPDAVTALRKGFTKVEEVKMKGEGMPRSKEEFEPIMRFWSEHLGRRQIEGLYEVMSGMAVPPHEAR
ncbi:hypothetical protein DICSQDRAFT_147998 [Dichomitus squalens LYAD-421 SS1]|uniref:Phospholipase/carboxylesterase/thioesterase domain-containing protein n=1 Tax=Dichomitus squalens (strain LYAD-421) TaxID=732165 RepID=R7SWM6_DICSQ|nr:uncharacterized protein DICSQDRAFT_147998 [Dichomitus squalens LYAD-421 SS1]EJF60353.1 hypothetical protein DICSQDRAFT_147998 [Dichomitus squalens LYAD-421 SS1]